MICIRTENGSLVMDVKTIKINMRRTPILNEGGYSATFITDYEVSIEYGNTGETITAGWYNTLQGATEQLNRIYDAIKDDRKVVSLSKE